MNGGIHQRAHITDLGAVINTQEMLAEPCVPLLPSGEETWSLRGAPMGTPPGGMLVRSEMGMGAESGFL